MVKLDMKKSLKSCYVSKKSIQFIEVPKIKYICFQGKGDPSVCQDYQDAMGVLYGLAYTIKFIYKAMEKDFVVMPLEGNWWSEPGTKFSEISRDEWLWEVMIAVPDYVEESIFDDARIKLKDKKDPKGLEKATFREIHDGLAAQFLYIGPYSDEGPYIEEMHKYVKDQGYKLRDRHREIYLSDPRRASPEKLKTIIRHPIEEVEGVMS